MKMKLTRGQFGSYVIVHESGEEILIQTDWEYPCLASCYGWVPCPYGDTDGTIDCDHRTVSEMIAEARDYLDDHLNESIEDPGYF